MAKCLTRALALAVGLAGFPAWAEEPWPAPRLPDGLQSFAIGQQMTVNGMPMRLRGFVSPQVPEALLPALRKSLGEPLVEDSRGMTQVLGRAEGNFYITVQVEPTASGSRGTVAVTDLAAASTGHAAHRAGMARWLDRLPAGTAVASDTASDEGGRQAQHLVFVNRHGASRNRDGVVTLMKNEGYNLEREVPDSPVARTANTSARADGATARGNFGGDAGTLYFTAPGKEAMAVIARTGDTTSIVLNIVTTLATFK